MPNDDTLDSVNYDDRSMPISDCHEPKPMHPSLVRKMEKAITNSGMPADMQDSALKILASSVKKQLSLA